MQAQLFRVVYDKGARWKVDVWAEDPASAQQAVAYGFGVQSLDDVSVRIVGIIPMETNR
jgi:S-adenosylhomocysteine hydrolase